MKDKLYRWIAKQLPRRLRYFVVIGAGADYSMANPTKVVPDITWDELAGSLEQ